MRNDYFTALDKVEPALEELGYELEDGDVRVEQELVEVAEREQGEYSFVDFYGGREAQRLVEEVERQLDDVPDITAHSSTSMHSLGYRRSNL
ncbi:MAG: hypothetical protein ABEJ98_04680 [Candidatus Nanohaloarchaea archaeon]